MGLRGSVLLGDMEEIQNGPWRYPTTEGIPTRKNTQKCHPLVTSDTYLSSGTEIGLVAVFLSELKHL